MLSYVSPPPKIVFQDERTLTFTVDNVRKQVNPPRLTTARRILTNTFLIKAEPEDFSHRKETQPIFVKGVLPGLVQTLHTAYQAHYALKLSVSDFIILIGQGLGKHMERYSEKLRKHFVNHEGKEKIAIRRDGFVMGQQNDWSTVFGEFAEKIKKRVKNNIYDVVIDDTSVATPNSRIVSEVTLMDCMKGYFNYEVETLCGIPEVTLEGTKEDWEKLRNKVKKLNEMNKDNCLELDFWLKHLTPVIEKICDTAIHKKIDKEFWSGIYKYKNPGSGTPYVSGWITKFFPYLFNGVNPFTTPAQISTNDIPIQISSVDFVWKYFGTEYEMKFHGGFLGAKYDENRNTVQAEYFWTVVFDEEKKSKEEIRKMKSIENVEAEEDSEPDPFDIEIAEMLAKRAKRKQEKELASKERKRKEPGNKEGASGEKPELKKTKKSAAPKNKNK